MIYTITRPTISSSMAAIDKTIPNRLLTRPLGLNRVKAVPRLVEQSAAPATKALRGLVSAMPSKYKDKAIGKRIPVTATATGSSRFFVRATKNVDRPPSKTRRRPRYPSW